MRPQGLHPGSAPNDEAIFKAFFYTTTHFLAYFGLNFCFKTRFLSTAKCVDATPRVPSKDVCPHLPPFCYATACIKKNWSLEIV